MEQGATKNLGSYGRQSQKVSVKISWKLMMYIVYQISGLNFDVQNQIIEIVPSIDEENCSLIFVWFEFYKTRSQGCDKLAIKNY